MDTAMEAGGHGGKRTMMMEVVWNEKCLPCPAISTYRTVTREIDLHHLSNACKESKQIFENDNYMKAEYLVLARIVYRMKQKFRTSKDFKVLEKLCKCLKLYFNINLLSHLETFIELIPTEYEKETYLPSKNLLDYFLVRLQGVAKLLEKTVDNCRETAYLLDNRIKTGQFWKIAFIAYSLISRLSILAKYTTHKVCEIYGKLISFSSKLRSTSRWLPEGYNLPSDLKQWLNVNWLDDDIQLIENSTDFSDIIRLYDLVEDSDVEFCDEYIIIQEEEKSSDKDDIKLIKPAAVVNIDEDVGNIIEIDNNFIPIDGVNLTLPKKRKMLEKKTKNKKAREKKMAKIKKDISVGVNKSSLTFSKDKKMSKKTKSTKNIASTNTQEHKHKRKRNLQEVGNVVNINDEFIPLNTSFNLLRNKRENKKHLKMKTNERNSKYQKKRKK